MPTDEFTKSLERKVEEVKSNDEWRDNFVTLEQKIQLEVREASERAREAALVEGRSEGLAKGLAEGLAEGRLEGTEINLLAQISKKLAKGKSVAQIADECEETEERIHELMKKL